MAGEITYTTAAFTGPLDLLLFLIQKAEVNIYDIPIAQITDQFLEYMKRSEVTALGDMSDFYRMASDLLWIKSRMLLPQQFDFDEEYEDPRAELVQRLLEYQKYKRYSQLLSKSARAGDFKLQRKPSQFFLPYSDQDLFSDAAVADLLRTYVELLSKLDDLSGQVFNVYEEVTVNSKITLLNELLDSKPEIGFLELVSDTTSRAHIISAFLAVLECVRDEMILIRQDSAYGDIAITRRPQDYVPESAGQGEYADGE